MAPDAVLLLEAEPGVDGVLESSVGRLALVWMDRFKPALSLKVLKGATGIF